MNDSPEQIREFLLSLGEDFDRRVDRITTASTEKELPELVEHPDPFGMDWTWLFPSERTESRDLVQSVGVRQQSEGRRLAERWLPTLVAAAAMLLVGAFVGRFALRPSEHLGGAEVLVAQVSTERVAVRGNEFESAVTVTSPFRGFVSAIAIRADGRPVVLPVLGADFVRAEKDRAAEPIVVPDGTEFVVAIVTETPAGDVIRRFAQEDRIANLVGGGAEQVREELERYLVEHGFDRMAVGMVTSVQRE